MSSNDQPTPPTSRKTGAQMWKDEGNTAFKAGLYEMAVEHYTAAMKADPSDHILPCNRAMARLKLNQWKLAEQDGTRSLNLLPSPNCKAHYRRGLARKALRMWKEAKEDFEAAVRIEPSNNAIATELDFVIGQLGSDRKDLPPRDTPEQSSQTSMFLAKNVKDKNNTSPPSSTISTSTSTASSPLDNPPASVSKPLAGYASSFPSDVSDSHDRDSPPTDLMREVSTRRFDSVKQSQQKVVAPDHPSGAFSALKDIRKKKEIGMLSFDTPGITSRSKASSASTSEAVPKRQTSKNNENIVKIVSGSVSVPGSSPRSFAELERRWGISAQPEARWSVLKNVDPQVLPVIFGEHLEPDFLDQMIEAFEVPQRTRNAVDLTQAVKLIEGLDRVSRLGTLTMFLTSEQKQGQFHHTRPRLFQTITLINDLLATHSTSSPKHLRPTLANWGL